MCSQFVLPDPLIRKQGGLRAREECHPALVRPESRCRAPGRRRPALLWTACTRGGPDGRGQSRPNDLELAMSDPTANSKVLRSDQASILIAFEDDGTWNVEAYIRAPHGINYLDKKYADEQPTLDKIWEDAQTLGIFSPRPCRLGGPIDPSMGHCILAMFQHYCQSLGLDAAQIIDTAYPDAPELKHLDFALVRTQAEWEGVDYPRQWSRGAFSLLLDAMDDVDFDILADFLRKHPRGISQRSS